MIVARINNLNFGYSKKNKVIDNFSYTFKSGRVYSIVGHNGAGKTTLMRLMLGILNDKSKAIEIGKNLSLAYAPDLGGLFEFLTVSENIEIFYKLNNNDDNYREYLNKSLSDWELRQKSLTQVRQLSMGQKQRLSLIVAGVNDPDIIFLDEPSNSIDINSQEMLNKFLSKFKNKGKTIILASHDLNLIENVCDEIVILDEGKIKYSGEMSSIDDFTKLYKQYTDGEDTDEEY